MRYTKLDTFHVRRKFNPSKKEDLNELTFFVKNKKWKGVCPFYLEYPWEDIPTMCKDKYSEFMLSK